MVELKLDTAAVEKLFPEGTELRVNLQQAVVNNIAKRILDRDISVRLETLIRTHVTHECGMMDLNTLVKNALDAHLEKSGWHDHRLKDSTTSQIRELVKKKVQQLADSEMQKIINDTLSRSTNTMKDTLDRHIDNALQDVEKHIAARLNQKFAAVVDAAIAAKLGMEVKK